MLKLALFTSLILIPLNANAQSFKVESIMYHTASAFDSFTTYKLFQRDPYSYENTITYRWTGRNMGLNLAASKSVDVALDLMLRKFGKNHRIEAKLFYYTLTGMRIYAGIHNLGVGYER